MKSILPAIAALACIWPATAHAGELFGGVYVHDIDSPLTKSGVEKGADVQLGYRWDRIGKTPLQPYLFGAVNTAGETHYAVAGISAKFGKRMFVRPGVGSRSTAATIRTSRTRSTMTSNMAPACCSPRSSGLAIRPASGSASRPASST